MKIEDDIYRSIHIKPDDGVKETVPVEESLLFNPAVKRRKLLLNVLSQKASDYVSVLRRAGINDDTEVVHYAVTALVELRNEYTLRFDRMEQKMASRRADPRILRDGHPLHAPAHEFFAGRKIVGYVNAINRSCF